jgi:hypothetical protein
LRDISYDFKSVPIMCDNTSAISISRNPVQHSKTKHIDVRHHFIRDHVEKGDVSLIYVSTDKQLADIFTKPLPDERFSTLRLELGMINKEALV